MSLFFIGYIMENEIILVLYRVYKQIVKGSIALLSFSWDAT